MIRDQNRPRFSQCTSRLASKFRLILAMLVACTIGPACFAEVTPKTESKTVLFNRDIRPILTDKCFQCHGPDPKQRKGKLRLDQARGALAPAASGSVAIVPGKIDESELFRRINSDDPEERMPPPKSGKSLSAAEVSRLKTWIEEGGEYQGHWAFLPPKRPSLPSVKNPGWCRNPIDFFILERLEAEG